MSTLIDQEIAPSQEPGRRRRRRLWVAGAVVAVVLIAFGVVAITYANTYQPLSADPTGGPLTSRIKVTSDGLENTNYVLVGPTGSRGVIEFGLSNHGPFAVHLTGLTSPGPITDLRWAPVNCGGNGCEPGRISASHPLPVTVPAHSALLLQATITQPRCTPATRGLSLRGFVIGWSALGVDHLFDVNLSPGTPPLLPILPCPTDRVAHLAH